MGNAASYDQLPSPLQCLNEDNMVVLLQYLEVPDFVHLTQTCRKFLNETLGPNNYFWAQVLTTYKPSKLYDAPEPERHRHFINHLLKTVRNGRKFLVNGVPLDLESSRFDSVDKHLVGHFDFKKEIKTYYLQVRCAQELQFQLTSFTNFTNAPQPAKITVRDSSLFCVNTSFTGFTNAPQPAKITVQDSSLFWVDLGVNASSLESLCDRKLPVEYRGVPVRYAHSNQIAAYPRFEERYVSRATPKPEAGPWRNLNNQYHQMQQLDFQKQVARYLDSPLRTLKFDSIV